MTYPIVFRISDWIIGGRGDTQQSINFMWWFKKSFLNPNLSFYNDVYLYHPTGVTMAFSDVSPFLMILSVPMQILVGRITTYNLFILSSFIISGFGVYLLVKYLTGDGRASFIAGVIFAFCPQHFMQALAHMNIASVQWLPFFILYFLKAVKDGSRKDAVFASVFLSLASLCSWFNALYILLFVGLYIAFNYFNDKEKILNRKVAGNLVLIGALSLLLIFPFLYPMLIELTRSNYMKPSPADSVWYSADLVGFFIPSRIHPLFGEYVASLYEKFTSHISENTIYIGYTVIFLVGYYVLKHRKSLGESKFWVVSSLFFFLLSLGPILHILGKTNFTVFNVTIPLPYLILYYIPPISITRVPSRLSIMLMLSLSVLTGYGIKEILHKISRKNIATILILSLILFEFVVFPCPTNKIDVPEFYKQISLESDNYAILEVPFRDMSEYMYYQTIHEKKLVGGYLSRAPEYATTFVENTPIISDFWSLHLKPDILNQNTLQMGAWLLDYYGIRYVVIHKNRLNSTEFEDVNDLSKKIFNDAPPVYEDETLVVYKVKKTYTPPLFMACEDNFYQAEICIDGNPWRWMDNNAKLVIINTKNYDININITFFVLSFVRPRTLEIRANNISVQNITVPQSDKFLTKPWQSERSVTIPNITLHSGKNVIEFYTPEGSEIVDEVLHNNDMRRVSLRLRNVSVGVRED
jgi:hypothetical protein